MACILSPQLVSNTYQHTDRWEVMESLVVSCNLITKNKKKIQTCPIAERSCVVTFTHHDRHRRIQTTQETDNIPDSLLTQLCYWIINEGEKDNDAGSSLSRRGNKSRAAASRRKQAKQEIEVFTVLVLLLRAAAVIETNSPRMSEGCNKLCSGF